MIHDTRFSRHLKRLRSAGLIAYKTQRIWAFYWVTDEGRSVCERLRRSHEAAGALLFWR